MAFVASIDQGTSSTRVIIFDEHGKDVAIHQTEFKCIYPKPGWVEQDPSDLLNTTVECLREAWKQMEEQGEKENIKAIGITNQRETTIVWDKTTGQPLYNALVWMDSRTSGVVAKMAEEHGGKDAFRAQCGLPLSTYFSGVKMRWLMENVPAVKKACDEGNAMMGTVDTWLVWNLTGGVKGGAFVTDVSNASRTMLMNLKTLQWDDTLLKYVDTDFKKNPFPSAFGIPKNVLPTICSSSQILGKAMTPCCKGVPIAGCLGDQQAALFGQMCFEKGSAKNTYGTGCFLLFNTGPTPVASQHGLLTTVAFRIGNDKAVYALEGSEAIAGAGVQWLRDKLGIISSAPECDTLAKAVQDTGGVYFVPAFAGLYAPYWRDDARGVICGLTGYTTKEHIARATLEAVCYRTEELLAAMNADSGVHLTTLKVDGGMTASDLTLQIQADLLGISITRRKRAPVITALGAAMAAGLAVGVWESLEAVKQCEPPMDRMFEPSIDQAEREQRLHGWKAAVKRTLPQ